MNRTEINRALAKCLAYAACGKVAEAKDWQRKLNELLAQAMGQ